MYATYSIQLDINYAHTMVIPTFQMMKKANSHESRNSNINRLGSHQ